MIRMNSKILLALGTLSIVVFLAVGGALYWYFGVSLSDIGEVQGEIETLGLKLKNVKVLENLLNENAGEREIIQNSFLGQRDLVRFIEDLERVGRDSGIDLKVESASLVSRPEELGPSFRLRAQGSFSALFQYLLLLENLPYEISFEEANLSFSGTGSRKGEAPWSGFYVIKLISYEF